MHFLCLQLCAHPLHWSEREREKERERERKRQRKREKERKRERERENMVIEFISLFLTMAALQIKNLNVKQFSKK